MKVTDLKARQELLDAWTRDLPDDLTQVQVAAVEAGVLEARQNLLVLAPTSSGKTLVGEMAAASLAFEGDGRYSIMVVPTRALAAEHFNRFRERYRDVLNVVISTGDWIEFDEDVRHGNFDLAVMTYEKLTILLGQASGAGKRGQSEPARDRRLQTHFPRRRFERLDEVEHVRGAPGGGPLRFPR